MPAPMAPVSSIRPTPRWRRTLLDATTPPAVCNPATDPTAPPCLAGALFVAPGGSDTSDGSAAHPFATVGHALAQPNLVGRIYICQGQYTERVALAFPAVADLYGGLTCPAPVDAGGAMISIDAGTDAQAAANLTLDGGAVGWGPGGGPTVFAPPSFDPQHNWALAIMGVSSPAHIQDVQFVAPSPSGFDTAGNGASSFAAVVISSSAELVNVALTAGRGVDGAPGVSGDLTPNYSAPTGANGSGAYVSSITSAFATAVGGTNACKYAHDDNGTPQSLDSSAGGNGGEIQNVNGSFVTTTMATPGTADPLPSPPAAMPSENGAAGLTGSDGAPGVARMAGMASTILGTLVATSSTFTWQPTGGASGGTGGPGQGGGGADGDDYMGGDQPGGSGGAGGCGGAGGSGGTGGGASVALVSIDSPSVTLTTCTLITGGGGTGGPGGPGQSGQPGGVGTFGLDGNNGGDGGPGAGGSGGAGGTGGISAAVLYRGTAPTLQSCSLTIGDPGHGGLGGAPGSQGQAWAGMPGAPGYDEYAEFGASLANEKTTLQAP